MSELAEQIAADKERVAELGAKVAATRQALEAASAKAREIGAEDVAARLERVAAKIEEAESGRVVLEGSLEKARWQVMTAIHGVGPGAPARPAGEAGGTGATGEAGAGGPTAAPGAAGGQVVGPDGEPLEESADALPLSFQRGDPSNAELTNAPGPFQKEHEGADEDQNKTKFQRFGRKLVRNTKSLADYSKKATETQANTIQDRYDPWGPGVQTTTEVTPTPPPTANLYRPDAADMKASDVVGTTIVVAVIAVEGISRLMGKRKKKSDDK